MGEKIPKGLDSSKIKQFVNNDENLSKLEKSNSVTTAVRA